MKPVTVLVRLPILLVALALGASCAVAPPPPAPAAPPRPRQADDSDLAASVPAAFHMALEIDMSRLRASSWSRPVLEASPAGDRAAQAESLGYDEIADTDRMLIAGGPGGAQLTIVQGRFDRDRVVHAFLARHPGAGEVERQGLRITRSADAALVFITARTFVAGSPDAVLAAVDCAFGLQADLRAGAALGDLRRELRSGQSAALLFTAVVTDEMRRQAGHDVPIPPELGRAAARLDLGDGLTVYSLGQLGDAGAAERMARDLRRELHSFKVRGMMMLLGLGGLVDQVQISTQGSRVVLRMELGAERREELAQALAGASAMMRQGARGAVP